ncbi:chitin-inducible gibberellin-responsive protein 1-like [Iris pallida]|uniref:Chitin-inducible gibberellin-responsive protein 1-like n=1 Tax=Iris pallida TaxID=29817 RepID=A0AAX6DZ05_IRIPA|nr:chitin-inducible gibberellin-responsive protein 1-like [Iris pallida]KAJ6797509.1 chitin-inducible gibberellin-responsive protein 1-like [Iris pallida]
MDSQQLKYGSTSPNSSSYEFRSARTPPYPEWTVGTINFGLGNSPNSPLSSQFDSDSLSVLSNNQEQQYSSTEAISSFSSSHYSPLEINSSVHQTLITAPESIQIRSSPPYSVSSQRMRHALQEIETVLMAPDSDQPSTGTNPEQDENKQPGPLLTKLRSRTWSPEVQPQNLPGLYLSPSGHEIRPEKRQREMRELAMGGNVRQLLARCAEALAENRKEDFKMLEKETRSVVNINGEPIQRLGAYMLEGLVARNETSGTTIYRAMRCREPESKELLSYMRILYDICPYFKFGYMAANGAIAEALRNEDRIHIIDFQIAQGTQWTTLIQALAARPGGPPHVRITGIDDPVSEFARGDSLALVEKMLAEMSKKFSIPLEFTPLPVYGPEVTREMLEIRPGEALAVNFTLQLHHTPDESVDVNNPRDGLLRMVKGLSPKVTTLVEQESNTNTTPFLMRFMETMDYYAAMFDSIDVTLPRDSKERIGVEQHCLAKDIVNVIACEGKERVERHELLGKWRSRLTMAGFKPYPLSSYLNSVIRKLLGYYSDKYTLVEKDGAMLLGWKHRNLISASAWH